MLKQRLVPLLDFGLKKIYVVKRIILKKFKFCRLKAVLPHLVDFLVENNAFTEENFNSKFF